MIVISQEESLRVDVYSLTLLEYAGIVYVYDYEKGDK